MAPTPSTSAFESFLTSTISPLQRLRKEGLRPSATDKVKAFRCSVGRRLERLIRLDHRVSRKVLCVTRLSLGVVLRVGPRR